jgi:hypothetical protein
MESKSVVVDQCPEIAVDHRLRTWFKPILQSRTNVSESQHVRMVAKLGQSLRRGEKPIADDERKFNELLASPETKGGVAVMLYQPGRFEPYHLGPTVTFKSCATYVALDDAIRAVTCGSLDFWQVTIVDSLPYIRPNDKISLELRTAWRENVFKVIRAKAPDVVLCMWKDNKGVSHDMETIRSIGVGKKFLEYKLPVGRGGGKAQSQCFSPELCHKLQSYH